MYDEQIQINKNRGDIESAENFSPNSPPSLPKDTNFAKLRETEVEDNIRDKDKELRQE